MIPTGERDERDALGNGDDVRQRIGTEAGEAEHASRGVAAHVAAALAARINERVLQRVPTDRGRLRAEGVIGTAQSGEGQLQLHVLAVGQLGRRHVGRVVVDVRELLRWRRAR